MLLTTSYLEMHSIIEHSKLDLFLKDVLQFFLFAFKLYWIFILNSYSMYEMVKPHSPGVANTML